MALEVLGPERAAEVGRPSRVGPQPPGPAFRPHPVAGDPGTAMLGPVHVHGPPLWDRAALGAQAEPHMHAASCSVARSPAPGAPPQA